MMSEDVLIQIFLWLPVISLLQFKSVCKPWRSIIENPFFIHLHATTKSGGSSSSFLFFQYPFAVEEKKEYVIFTLSGDDNKFDVYEDLGRPSVEFEEEFDVYEEDLGIPSVEFEEEFEVYEEDLGRPSVEFVEEWVNRRKTFYHGIVMVGCCNGIICLLDNFSRSIALWNPAIKQSRILPKPSNLLTQNHYQTSCYVGFGMDVMKTTTTTKKIINDYKVLLITSLITCDASSYEVEYNSEYYGHDKTKFPFARNVHVYSSSTDSWKCIDANLSVAHPDLEIHVYSRESPLHLNGRVFFMAKYYIIKEEEELEEDNNSDNNSGLQAMPLIMSFDFTQEIFRTIELPYDRRSKFYRRCDADLFLFGEKIALNDFLFHSCNECDIWVLNEQQQGGVMEESWTKFYTFGPYKSCYGPVCILDNGEFAIMHGNDQDPNCQGHGLKLQLLNLSTGEANDIQCDCKLVCQVDVYKPSLVPISGNGATVDKPICGV